MQQIDAFEADPPPAIDVILELRREGLRAEAVERIDLHVFDVSYEIIGPGAGDKKTATARAPGTSRTASRAGSMCR